MKNVVMTVIGVDRPGLVERLASLVTENGGNWLESRMSHLGGQFAGIVRVQVASDQASAMLASLKDLESDGLRVVAALDEATEAPSPGEERPRLVTSRTVTLDLTGQDRPGIVRQLSQALAMRGVNVEELNTEVTSAPMSGEPLFRATARLKVPRDLELENLRQDLERIAADMMVDISLETE